jgi:hypothetical protein
MSVGRGVTARSVGPFQSAEVPLDALSQAPMFSVRASIRASVRAIVKRRL